MTFLKKTEIKTIQSNEILENRIASNDSKDVVRHKTIDQEIQIRREDSTKRPSSSKPDSRRITPNILNRKEYNSISKPANVSKVINSVIPNRRGDVQNNLNNIHNENNINYNNPMKIIPNSISNVIRHNNRGNAPISDVNRGININNKK